MHHALLFSVFIIASCGLAYELIAAGLASYLLGDSITQFSTVIGVYLFAMGVGSWLAKYIVRDLIGRFIQIELMVGLMGGFSAALLFSIFTWMSEPFKLVLYLVVFLVGVLVGLDLPLVMRILKHDLEFKEVVSRVLTFDYLGALAVSVLLPLILIPHIGMVRSCLMFGLMNALVALWVFHLYKSQLGARVGLWLQCWAVILVLLGGLIGAGKLTTLSEAHIYADEIIFTESSPYQRIVLTRWRDDLRLFLNGNLQFSSQDEYRYHESLVHPGMAAMPWARRILVLGGGDGLAIREILKYPQVETVTLVDLDPAMTRLFATAPMLTALNENALKSTKVKVINADALTWLENEKGYYDFVVVDFPDPANFSLGKLYSSAFYRLLEKRLSVRGQMVVQSTSPLYARQSFWCVVTTLESVGFKTRPYHALVPSFGEWGFILAGREALPIPAGYPVATRFLNAETTPALFNFPADMARVPSEVNQLNNQVLVRYFEQEWRRVIR